MSSLTGYVEKLVLVVTQDGRVIQGTLKGFDQTTNIILSGSIERVFHHEEPVEEVDLGIYLIRGDNITLVGQVDEEKDKETDWKAITAAAIPEIQH